MICGESNSAISCSNMWSPDNSKMVKKSIRKLASLKIIFNYLAKLAFAAHSEQCKVSKLLICKEAKMSTFMTQNSTW